MKPTTQCEHDLDAEQCLLCLREENFRLQGECKRLEESLAHIRAVIDWNASPAKSCLAARAEGKGGCSACSVCCGELWNRVEVLELERSANCWPASAAIKAAAMEQRELIARTLECQLEPPDWTVEAVRLVRNAPLVAEKP